MAHIYIADKTDVLLEKISLADNRTKTGELQYLCEQQSAKQQLASLSLNTPRRMARKASGRGKAGLSTKNGQ